MKFKTTSVQLPVQLYKDLLKHKISFVECMRVGSTTLLAEKSKKYNNLQVKRRVNLMEQRLKKLTEDLENLKNGVIQNEVTAL